MQIPFRVTEITRYLSRPDPRVKVVLAVSHAGQTPPFPVNGSMTLDLEEAGHFELDDVVSVAFEFDGDKFVPAAPPELFSFDMHNAESLGDNIERLAGEFVEWVNQK